MEKTSTRTKQQKIKNFKWKKMPTGKEENSGIQIVLEADVAYVRLFPQISRFKYS
jgi:hypothetical protein